MKNLILNFGLALGLFVLTSQAVYASGPMQPKIVSELDTTDDVFYCDDCTIGLDEYIMIMYTSPARTEIFKIFYWNSINTDEKELAFFGTEYMSGGGLSGTTGRLMFPNSDYFYEFTVIDQTYFLLNFGEETSDLYDYLGNFNFD